MQIEKLPALLLSLCLIAPLSTAHGQSIDEALRLYKDHDYKDAALAFYDVLTNEVNPDTRDQAQIYLAETLRKMQLWVPALFYYTDIFRVGRGNRYYLNAVEGLLAIQIAWHDPVIVPSLVNNLLDPEGFGQLDPQKIAHVNYMIGELSYRQRKNQDARAFLEYVPPESPLHTRARFILGLLEVRAGNPDAALDHFKQILSIIDVDTDFDDQKRVRNLAIIAAARAAYGAGRYAEATEYYLDVPRFGQQWFTAMYENAWAYFQQGDYGRALGEIQSITSPYFEKRHVPEAYVIAAISYFVNCQWDRVRREIAAFKSNYDPMLTALTAYLGEKRDPAEFYRDVVAGGAGRFSIELARDVRRIKRFKDYHFMLIHTDWEEKEIKRITEWKNSRLIEALSEIVSQQQEELEPAIGSWVRLQLRNRMAALKNFKAQIDILDFEVADAERKWLEQGQEILKGRRARLPRPMIPSDQWQHWSFETEYWKDELGFIQHTIATECLEVEE